MVRVLWPRVPGELSALLEELRRLEGARPWRPSPGPQLQSSDQPGPDQPGPDQPGPDQPVPELAVTELAGGWRLHVGGGVQATGAASRPPGPGAVGARGPDLRELGPLVDWTYGLQGAAASGGELPF